MADLTGTPGLNTTLLGLIGADLSLSRTPAMHEAEGLAQGRPVVYRRIDTLTPRLRDRSPGELLSAAVDLGFDGLNITHPYKQAVLDHLDEVDPAARQVGAVNTVVIRDGRLTGHNTDVTGYLRAFRDNLGDAPRGGVLQLGAGGVGGSVAVALVTAGVESLVIADLDADRARSLAASVNRSTGTDVARGAALAEVPALVPTVDGVVNATPVGMLSHPGTAVDPALVTARQWVSDVIYMPLETELLRAARATGCRTLDGTAMAVNQAVDAFAHFTGLTADRDRMRATFLSQG